MPVLIDQIDTEIEMMPRNSAPAESGGAPAQRSQAPSRDDFHRRVVAVFESELDTYLRMRG